MVTTFTESHLRERVKMAQYYDYCKDNVQAFKMLDSVWSDIDAFPDINGLSDQLTCEILIIAGSILSNHALYKQENKYFEKAQNVLTNAREFAEQINDRFLLADAEKQISVSYWREGRYENAVVYANSALSYFSESDQLTKDVCLLVKTNLIILYFRINDFNGCLQLIKENEPFVEASENERVKTCFYGHAGLFYLFTDNYDLAIKYFQKSLVYTVSTKNRTYEGTLFNNISMMHLRLGQFAAAHDYAKRAINVFAELGLDLSLAQVLETQATIYIAENLLHKATLKINESISILRKGENYPQILETLWTQTRIHFLLNEKRAAILQFNEIINICQEHLSVSFTNFYLENFIKTIYLESGLNFYEKSENYRIYLLNNALEKGGGLVNPTAEILGMSHQNLSAQLKKYPQLCKKHGVPTRASRARIVNPAKNKTGTKDIYFDVKSDNLAYLGIHKGMKVVARPINLAALDFSQPVIFKDLDNHYHSGYLINDFGMYAFGNGMDGEIENTYFDNEIKLTAQIIKFYDEKMDDFRPLSDLGI